MTSAFHRPEGLPPGATPVGHRRVTWRLHPALTDVLNALGETSLGQAFKDRAVEVSTSKAFSDPVDHSSALVAYCHLLEWADGDGLQLTASGYLKPADVAALAAMMPTMRGWMHKMSREIDVHPVLFFREQVKSMGLLRKYKGSLRLTKAGREGLGNATALWEHLADALVPADPAFGTDASVVVLVHMATTEGEIDVGAVAKTLTALGWSHRDGSPVGSGEVYDVWNDLWVVLGNIGEHEGHSRVERRLSPAARILIHDALFDEVPER